MGFWLQWPAISRGKTWTPILFNKPCQSPGVTAKALASCQRWQSSVLSQKFLEEVSPDLSGRKNVAHGVSRGSANPPSPPSPLPLGRERGVPQTRDGVRALHPRACALGYNLPPLTGLRKGRPHEEDFVSGLLTQDTSWAPTPSPRASGDFAGPFATAVRWRLRATCPLRLSRNRAVARASGQLFECLHNWGE